MAVTVSASGTNQTLALTKIDCGKLAEYLARGGAKHLGLNPAIINVLKAIAGSADTTSLATA
jgi:hypothetical protein